MAAVGGVVDTAAYLAHAVKDPKQAEVGADPRIGSASSPSPATLAVQNLKEMLEHRGCSRRHVAGRLDAHTELAIESMMVP